MWWFGVSTCHSCGNSVPLLCFQTYFQDIYEQKKNSPVVNCMWVNWLALEMPDVDQFQLFKIGSDSGNRTVQGQLLVPCPVLTQGVIHNELAKIWEAFAL